MSFSQKRYFFARNAGMHKIFKRVLYFLALLWITLFIIAYVPFNTNEIACKILIDNAEVLFNFISSIFTGYIVSFMYYKLNTYPEIIRNDKLKEISLYNIANTFSEMLLLRNIIHNINLENDNYNKSNKEILLFATNNIKNSVYFISYTQGLFSSEILDVSKKMQVYIEKILAELNNGNIIANDTFGEVDKLSNNLFSVDFFGIYEDKDEIKRLYDKYNEQCTLQTFSELFGMGINSYVGTNFTATVRNVTEKNR